MTSKPTKQIYEFGPFRLDAAERLLLRDGRPVPLPPKVFDTLVVLVENSGRLVEKDELLAKLWPDTFVEEATIARNISDLRKALGEAPGGHKYIKTVPRHGYRFAAAVLRPQENAATLVIERHTRSHIVAEESEAGAQAEVEQAARSQAAGAAVSGNRLAGRKAFPTLAVAVAALAGLAAAFFYFQAMGEKEGGALTGVRTIAVLPFKPMTGQEGDEYLELGMADALITRLANVRQIIVRPTSAVLKYQKLGQDVAAAGRELGVDALLDGRIQRADDRVRVTVQLVSARDGAPLWADRFEAKFTDIFAVQDSISAQVARALALNLTGEERQRLAKHYTDNTEAYHLYVKGRYIWSKRRREDYDKAIEYFHQAIALDPAYALAYVGLADCYALGGGGRSGKETYPKAKAAAMRALEIDEMLAEAHAALGLAQMFYDWDLSAAEAAFKRALEINPNYATAHQWYAECLAVMGRTEEALAQIKQAQELDPLSEIIIRDKGRILYYARRYDEAIAECRTALEMNARFYPATLTLGDIHAQQRRYDEAIAYYQEAVSMVPGMALMKALLAHAYAISGRKDEAQKILDELTAQSEQRPIPAYDLALIHAGLGQQDQAFAWLNKAHEERSYRLVYLGVDPIFDPLRGDPRFADLLGRVRLPQS